MSGTALVLASALSLFAGCGAKSITVGSTPFPAEKPVFVDEAGKETAALPPSPESLRLVFFDSPWCPQCAEAWTAMRSASETFPPGSVRVYRILFDRERIYAKGESRETSPLHPLLEKKPENVPSDAGRLPVTILTALPGPFRDQYRVGQVPLLLLLDESGRVEKRWIGYSPSLGDQLAQEVRRRTNTPLPAGK